MNTALPLNQNNPYLTHGLLVVATVIVSLSGWLAKIEWSATLASLGSITVAQYSLLSLVMFAYWYLGPKSNNWRDYRALLAIAVLVRLILVPISPYTSNDVDRYLFDGKVALEGHDPYRTPHNDPTVAELKEHWPTPPEHAKYPTLYPPGAIALYASAAATGHEYAQLTWKVLTSLASIALLFIMVLVLTKMQTLKHISLIALSPLLIFETGVGAHVDIFSALAITCGLYFWQKKQLAFTGAVIGVGALIKLVPILLLVPLCFSQKRLKHFFTLGLSAAAVIVAGYGLAFAIGMQPIGSTPVFFEKWRNASPLFEVLNNYITGKLLLFTVVGIILTTLGTIALVAWLKRPLYQQDVVGYMQVAIAVPLLVSPVVFPWYVLPLVVLFAIRPSFFMASWFVLLPITYEVLNQFACCNVWAPQQWPVYLLGLGLVIGFIIDRLLSYKQVKRHKHYA
jgi:hypothetical protein